MGNSFATISSIGPNGAVIHYEPEKDTALKMNNKEVYLLDSGGQYLDGTTDVTRTLHFTEPTAYQREMYTRVLLGNLDLERLIWSKSSRFTGSDMDVLARRPLWDVGEDYAHATGHGVGYFLCVHEDPIIICKHNDGIILTEGMCASNEPGFYKDGEFGIRIENVMMVVTDKARPDYYAWENLTILPYCRELIDTKFLQKKDIDFLNAFHKHVEEVLSKCLCEDDKLTREYLKKQCAPL